MGSYFGHLFINELFTRQYNCFWTVNCICFGIITIHSLRYKPVSSVESPRNVPLSPPAQLPHQYDLADTLKGLQPPQTIVYEQSPAGPEVLPPAQPLLKYHLIRHSFPAKGDEEYFENIPAFLPGPPYLSKGLPNK